MASSLIHVVIGDDPPSRLDKALARDVPEAAHLSRSRLTKLIGAGAVRSQGLAVTDAKARVTTGDVFEIEVEDAADVDIRAEAIPLTIVHEDTDLIVIDKPAGMVVHPAPGTPDGTLVNALLHHFGGDLSGVGGEKRPGIVHRIDKDTSGLLVVAKSDAAHHGLAAQFEAHSVDREYLAVCHGVPDVGDPRLLGTRGVSIEKGATIKITTSLARHRTDRQRQAVYFDKGRHAVTRIKVDKTFGNQAAVVRCRLETGRTHQIRVHLAHIGHGLIGDPVYGGRRKVNAKLLGEEATQVVSRFSRQALHAARLGFDHPVSGRPMTFDSPVQDDMQHLIAALHQDD
jgi:23S rRNA pseudouridine1911/1915/1917 synthase